ncbi:hypothetical protein BpHYR1_042493 [Brachionus plicatilis]|uniref:Uncharacterized protein n=1 Tax=Brachionus plicatilis TaxID=10195 RepID=A0A3M7SXA7_BRAPC|nr:hypothetical protein BpHYR1_042493 [Brachionus plicatilis]
MTPAVVPIQICILCIRIISSIPASFCTTHCFMLISAKTSFRSNVVRHATQTAQVQLPPAAK